MIKTNYVVSSKYVEGDKLSGKEIKLFPDKKQAIKHACKLMILKQGEIVYEVWREKVQNGLIFDNEMVFTTESDFSDRDPARHQLFKQFYTLKPALIYS